MLIEFAQRKCEQVFQLHVRAEREVRITSRNADMPAEVDGDVDDVAAVEHSRLRIGLSVYIWTGVGDQ